MHIEKLSEIVRAFCIHGYDNIDVCCTYDLIMFSAPEDVPKELKETLHYLKVRWDERDRYWYVFV